MIWVLRHHEWDAVLRIPVFTTDCFPALQFNPSQKPFVAFRTR